MISQASNRNSKLTLKGHPVLDAINTRNHLVAFMQYHIILIWCITSLTKSLYAYRNSSRSLWYPDTNVALRSLINEITLELESCPLMSGLSHVEWYMQLMHVYGADTTDVDYLLEMIREYNDYHCVVDSKTSSMSQLVGFSLDNATRKDPVSILASLIFGYFEPFSILYPTLIQQLARHPSIKAGPIVQYLKNFTLWYSANRRAKALNVMSFLCKNDAKKHQYCLMISAKHLKLWGFALDTILFDIKNTVLPENDRKRRFSR